MQNLFDDENEPKINEYNNIHKNIHSEISHISVGKKISKYSFYSSNLTKDENNKEILQKYSSKTSNSKPNLYLQKYQSSNNLNMINNHLLFDSNKQKIINTDDSNYVRFISNDKKKRYKKYSNLKNENNQQTALKANYLAFNNKNNLNNEDKYEKAINFIKNYSRNNTTNNSRNNTINNNVTISTLQKTYNNYNYKKDNPKDKRINKSLNICTCNSNNLKIPVIQQRNHYIYNISNIKTEVSSNDYSPNQSQSANKNFKHNYIKTDLNDNNYLNETNKKINIIKTRNRNRNVSTKQTSSVVTRIYSCSDTINNNMKNNQLERKTSKNKDNLPINIKLNIENVNKEKLSRIKRIIEKNLKNYNSYQVGLPKANLANKPNKSVEKRNIVKKDKEIDEKFVFKKKKIMSLKENNNEGTHLTKNTFHKIKDNNKIQSSVATNNLFVHKKNNDILNKLNINETDKDRNEIRQNNNNNNAYTSYMNKLNKNNDNNNNNEDTMTLSYSKENNISISSKSKKNSIVFPFFVEKFNIYYDVYNKQLIINDKSCFKEDKNNIRNNDFDDDDYLLTKEILLLKKGLAKKSELNNEMKRKLKELKPVKIANFSLFKVGHKKIYMKKTTTNYKNYRF